MPGVNLFVYGTLRRGGAAAHQMAGATWLGTTRTAARYTLVRISWYPGLRLGGDTAIVGDLFEVPYEMLAGLDEFEGPEYGRESVLLDDGTQALAYVLLPAWDRGYPAVPSGDWLQES